MGRPQAVPGQVLFTDAELSALAKRTGLLPDPLRRIFAALHHMRLGDPAGTVRRSSAGSIALRDQSTAAGSLRELVWEIVHLEEGDCIDDDIEAWPTVHRESWLERLTVQDYEALEVVEDTK